MKRKPYRLRARFTGMIALLGLACCFCVLAGCAIAGPGSDGVSVSEESPPTKEPEEKILEIERQTDVYLLPGEEAVFSFTAPENGGYTFETVGTVAAELTSDVNASQDKDDKINRAMKATLERGRKISLRTKPRKPHAGPVRYSILATFTPIELAASGDEQTVSVARGEREYVAIMVDEAGPVEWAIDTGGAKIGVSIGYASIYNFEKESFRETQDARGSFFADLPGRYYVRISNHEESEIEAAVRTEEPETLDFKPLSGETEFTKIYKFHTDYALAAEVKVECDGHKTIGIKDERLGEIVGGDPLKNTELYFQPDPGKDYYFYIRPADDRPLHYEVKVAPDAVPIRWGENTGLKKWHEKQLYKLPDAETDVRVTIETDANSVALYNAQMERQSSFLLNKEETYFLGVSGGAHTFSVSLTPVTSELRGTISEDGFCFIRYVPSRSDRYEIEGGEAFAWYDDQMNRTGDRLSVRDTYYLKIEGERGSAYEVSLREIFETLRLHGDDSLTANMNAGYYRFEAERTGAYRLRVTSSRNIYLNVYGCDHKPLAENVDVSAASQTLDLDRGTYYFEFKAADGATAALTLFVFYSAPNDS